VLLCVLVGTEHDLRDVSQIVVDVYDEDLASAVRASTANCIIIDHLSAFEFQLVAPFLYAA
jgi:hypothetical protein